MLIISMIYNLQIVFYMVTRNGKKYHCLISVGLILVYEVVLYIDVIDSIELRICFFLKIYQLDSLV